MKRQTEYHNDASGVKYQIFKTPMGHWRAYQVEGVERNYASIPASFIAPTRKSILKELSKHWSN